MSQEWLDSFAEMVLSLNAKRPYSFDIPTDSTMLSGTEVSQRSEYLAAMKWEQKRLSDIRNTIKHLQEEEKTASRNISYLCGASQPLHTIPDELLAEVFLAARNSADSDLQRSYIPLTIAAVCRRWRNISINSPQLWSTLPPQVSRHLLLGRAAEHALFSTVPSPAVTPYIDRSGAVPLTLRVASSRLNSQDVLPRFSNRIGHLYLDIDRPGATLPVFEFRGLRQATVTGSRIYRGSICDPFDFFADAPLLETISIRFDVGYRPTKATALFSVRHFVGRSASWAEACLLLKRFPNAQRISMSLVEYKGTDAELAGQVDLDLQLPRCTHLQLCDEDSDVVIRSTRSILLAFKSVTHLELSTKMIALPTQWSALPNIQHLDLRGSGAKTDNLENAVLSLPFLRSLYAGYESGLLDILHKLATQGSQPLLNLRVLYLEVEYHALVDIPIEECKALTSIGRAMEVGENFQEFHFAGCLRNPHQFDTSLHDYGWCGWVGMVEEAQMKICVELAQFWDSLNNSTIPLSTKVRHWLTLSLEFMG